MFELGVAEFDREFRSSNWLAIAKEICHSLGLPFDLLERAEGTDHVVIFIDRELVLKIFRPGRGGYEREVKALRTIHGKTLFSTPEIVHFGEIREFQYIVISRLQGTSLSRAELLTLPQRARSQIVDTLAACLRQMHTLDASEFECDWQAFIQRQVETFIARQIDHGVNPKIIDALPAYLDENLSTVPTSPTVFLHGDVHFGNLRFKRIDGDWQVTSLFDFADSRRGYFEYDLLAIGVLILQGEKELQREFLLSYGYREHELDEAMRRRLMMLTMLYETSDLRRYAQRLRPDAIELGLDELERAIWSFV